MFIDKQQQINTDLIISIFFLIYPAIIDYPFPHTLGIAYIMFTFWKKCLTEWFLIYKWVAWSRVSFGFFLSVFTEEFLVF